MHTWLEPTFGTQAWGVAIILLTLIVRLVLFPLTFKQYQGALRMQALQPKIKELQRKYKNDRALLQQETMKLYQQYRVNPFASCLPVLLQLPVFICLYYAIRYTRLSSWRRSCGSRPARSSRSIRTSSSTGSATPTPTTSSSSSTSSRR